MVEGFVGPETREAWIARQRDARLRFQALLRAKYIKGETWLKSANRHLEAALKLNRTLYGLNDHALTDSSVLQGSQARQEAILPPAPPQVEQRADDKQGLGGVAL